MGCPLGYGSLKVGNFRFGMFFESLNEVAGCLDV